MRRILLLAVGVLALALAAPTLASAQGHHHRHHHHKKAHKAKARLRHIVAKHANATDPGAPVSGDAGTVASFADGVLTITLADGSTVSGTVTDRTEIHCETAAAPPSTPTAVAAHDGGGDWGDDESGDSQSGDDQGDGRHDCGGGASACSVSDLVPGAIVHEAELRIGAGGAEFNEITLVQQQQATT